MAGCVYVIRVVVVVGWSQLVYVVGLVVVELW